MANKRWKGKALARAEVKTLTLGGTWQAGDTITFSIPDTTGKLFTLTVGATVTTTAIGTAIVEAWNAANGDDLATDYSATEYGANIPEFDEITAAAASSTTVTFTHDTKGTPFSLTVTRVSGVSGTVSLAATTAATGPNHWDEPNNWDSGTIPVGSAAAPVQSAAVAIAGGSLTDMQAYYWVVTATNANGESVKSNEQTLTIAATDQTATLTWAQVTNATGYKIYRSTSAGAYGATSLVTTIGSGATLTYNDTGAALSSGTPPATTSALGDTVYIGYNDIDIRYGLNQSAVTGLTIYRDLSHEGEIGLPEVNQEGAEYHEYRGQYLQLAGGTLYHGRGQGNGAGMCKIDFGSTLFAATVEGTGSPSEGDIPAVCLKGTHASNTLTVRGDSSVGVAVYGGETANIDTLTAEGDANLLFGAGGTLETGVIRGSAVATLFGPVSTSLSVHDAAEVSIDGENAVAQLTVRNSAAVNYHTTGTLGGNTALSENAVLSFDGDPRTKTVTNPIDVYGAAQVVDNDKVVSSLIIDYNETTPGLQLGTNIRITRGAVA